ncbi:Utp14 protein-domain-containing protein [Gaertneriomyces semiglobifer]|nr:Utp14 protein-domain-containing protein [Gaertneriomyces semiglobifer]
MAGQKRHAVKKDAKGERPAKHRRIGGAPTPLGSTKEKVAKGRGAPSQGKGKGKGNTSIYDVFEATDDEEDERRLLAQRRGGGGSTLDEVGNYEYHVDEIDDEDDEEIDEDEAFNDSDEERYGEYFISKSTVSDSEHDLLSEGDGSAQPRMDASDAETEDEDDDEDPEAYVDLSALLDSDKPTKSSSSGSRGVRGDFGGLLPLDNDGETDEDGSDNLDASSDDDAALSDTDDMDVDAKLKTEKEALIDQLSSYVLSLDSSNRDKKRKRLHEKTETAAESEYNIGAMGARQSRSKLSLQDLMGSLGDETSFGGLKKQLESLENPRAKVQTVPAPLPRRIQDRYDREVAYTEAKKDVSKWTALVKKNREATQLVLPAADTPTANISSGQLVGKFQPTAELETEVHKILEEAQLLEKQQQEAEELAMNSLSKEEVLERRAELQKMRALLFYKEQKQKKVAKIKSKAYRKLHKKNKDAELGDLSLEELQRLDPEAAQEHIRKIETARAQERMTLKHKNTSKWAKRALANRDGNPETQQAIIDQLNKHQELRRKIAGVESGDSDVESSDGGLEDESDIRRNALEQLDMVERELEDEDDGNGTPATGVFAMKFMQRAVQKQKEQVKENIQRTRAGIQDDYSESGDDGESADDERPAGKAVDGNLGRMTFTNRGETAKPSAGREAVSDDEEDVDGYSIRVAKPVAVSHPGGVPKQRPLFEVPTFELQEVKDTSFTGNVNGHENFASKSSLGEDELVSTGKTEEEAQTDKPQQPSKLAVAPKRTAGTAAAPKPSTRTQPQQIPTDVNPWLLEADDARPTKKAKVDSQSKGKQQKAADKLAHERKASRRAEGDLAMGDVQLDLDGVRALESTKATRNALDAANPGNPSAPGVPDERMKKAAPVAGTTPAAMQYDDSDADSDFGDSLTMVHGDKPRTAAQLSQRELMQLAFANDDVVAEFEEEKERIVNEDQVKEVDVTLPGWGSWGGVGVAPKKHSNKKPAKIGAQEIKRQDAKLKHVIINEKKLKKSAKYMLPTVPHGFDNKEQYERTIRAPLGKEWNAANGHNSAILPRVQPKLGTVIAPLKFTGSGKKKAGSNKRK